VPAHDPLARALLERELTEGVDARAARLAYQRWITQLRIWAAIDRAGIAEPGEQAAFIARSLWPDLRPEVALAWVEAVRDATGKGRPLLRPVRPRDVIGDELERLLIAHGYVTEDVIAGPAAALAEPPRPREPSGPGEPPAIMAPPGGGAR
jgi:hypothetical protein